MLLPCGAVRTDQGSIPVMLALAPEEPAVRTLPNARHGLRFQFNTTIAGVVPWIARREMTTRRRTLFACLESRRYCAFHKQGHALCSRSNTCRECPNLNTEHSSRNNLPTNQLDEDEQAQTVGRGVAHPRLESTPAG